MQDLFRRSPSASACRSPPFRRDTAPWPSRRAVPPRPASRGPCVDMLEMSGSETTTLGIGQAALSLPAASEALLKPPMWTCVNFLSESYISRGGGSLAWFRGHGPDYGWRPSTHMRRKPLIPGGDPPGVRIPAAAPTFLPPKKSAEDPSIPLLRNLCQARFCNDGALYTKAVQNATKAAVQKQAKRSPNPSDKEASAICAAWQGSSRGTPGSAGGTRPSTPHGKTPHPGGSARGRRIYTLPRAVTRGLAACPPPCRRSAHIPTAPCTTSVASSASPARSTWC